MAIVKSWPPSPCCEDEVASLAREHGSDSSENDFDHGKSPAASRGSVDQIPLIVDADAKDVPTYKKETLDKAIPKPAEIPPYAAKAGSSRTPQTQNDERRYVHVPSGSDTLGVPPAQFRPRSKSTTGIDGDETPRGRPQMHRLQTEFSGGDVHSMATGQRRAPSPYAYRPPPAVHQKGFADRPKSTLLSPESATTLQPPDSYSRRSRSARPERKSTIVDSSDSDRKSSRRRHRSKSRRRPDDNKHATSGGEEYFSDRRPERRGSFDRSRPSRPDPPRGRDSDKSHRSVHGDITPPQTPSFARESPYVSAAEDSDRRRRASSRHPERRYSKESSYSSSGEKASKRRSGEEQNRQPLSRRGSTRRTNRPQLDLSNQASESRRTGNSHGVQTPKAMEDYFQRAFDANSSKQSQRVSQYSAHPSPFTSPPTSPPRTPRGERNMKDYFEMNAPASPSKQTRPRSTVPEDNPIKPLTSLLGAATLGASLAAKIPTLSRSSTASLETPSSGSLGSLPSAQRSRKPSPIIDEAVPTNARPGSRTGSFTGRDEIYRSNTASDEYNRPASRAGSTASWDDPYQHRANTYPVFDDRPSSRNGSLSSNSAEHPHLGQRAASYSSYDQQRTRPSSRRTYSTNGSTTIMPASSNHNPQRPSHLSRMSTSIPTPDKMPQTPTTPAAAPAPEQRPISFPKCPQPYPVAGYHHWYTIQGLQNFDICASCASVVGSSEFRDYCVPSWKPASEAVTCALSRPYIRIAVARALKEKSANVNLLQELNTLPSGVMTCPGSNPDLRRWYHITDPLTKSPIAKFDVCTACVRSVELLFPELRKEKLFERPDTKLSAERTCNLNASSKHFYPIVNELDKLARYSRKKDLRPKDITAFGEVMRQKTRYRECAKDAMLATTLWHYMPRLPELTVCEECFEEFVWPMRNMPIAKDMLPTLQRVPIQRPDNYVAGISCQLYSERMRAIFKNACSRNDFEGLRQSALMRYNVEHKLQEKFRQLRQDMERGEDRREEVERNSSLWKTYE
jgi:hypothetical protein